MSTPEDFKILTDNGLGRYIQVFIDRHITMYDISMLDENLESGIYQYFRLGPRILLRSLARKLRLNK